MFRPVDDACVYPFLIPSNLFAVRSLRIRVMRRTMHGDKALAPSAMPLDDRSGAALMVHGRIRRRTRDAFFVYETDGFGNTLFMDDANIPGLMSLSYLGCWGRDDPVCANTRKRAWARQSLLRQGYCAKRVGGRTWPQDDLADVDHECAPCASDSDARSVNAALLKRSHAQTASCMSFDQDIFSFYAEVVRVGKRPVCAN